jgi:hypothetical protein
MSSGRSPSITETLIEWTGAWNRLQNIHVNLKIWSKSPWTDLTRSGELSPVNGACSSHETSKGKLNVFPYYMHPVVYITLINKIIKPSTQHYLYITNIHIVARMRRLYKTGIGLTTGFIGSHSYTQLQCIRSYSSLQFTITLAESPHCVFTRCLSSNIVASVRLQLCNSSLKTAARPEH